MPVHAFSAVDADLNQKFQKSYSAYKELVASGSTNGLPALAREAYQYGKELYGPDTETTAVLALNYSTSVSVYSVAEEFAKESLSILENKVGKDSIKLIDSLMQLGKVYAKNLDERAAHRNLGRAIKIAGKNFPDDIMLQANLNFEAGTILTNHILSNRAIGLLNKAKNLYLSQENLEAEHQVHYIDFWIGKIRLSEKKYKKALARFLPSLEYFSKIGAKDKITLTIHAFLTQTYESMGDTDNATKHLQIIGAARGDKIEKDPIPIYSVSPDYPPNAARMRKEGWVLVTFMINTEGRPMDAIVTDSFGAKAFEAEAKKAIEKFRFAPRFKNGKAVSTNNVRYRFSFSMVE